MKPRRVIPPALLFLLYLLVGCGAAGGGGGGLASLPGGGIGGSGVISTGTIDGFGSIFVNGVEFQTDTADVFLDGVAASEAQLRLGMVVTVVGRVNEDGVTGVAERVIFDDLIEGPVQSVSPGPDGDNLNLSIMGVQVVARLGETVFEGVSAGELAEGDLVEVSGFPVSGQRLQATRIEKRADFVPGASEVELQGVVAGLDEASFMLGEIVVDYSTAQLVDIPDDMLVENAEVEVRGTLSGNVIAAAVIEAKKDTTTLVAQDTEVQVSGAILDFAGDGQFRVGDYAVDASDAQRLPADLEFTEGLEVQVEGVWNGSVLVARRVESRDVRLRIEAGVIAVDVEAARITLGLVPGDLTVTVDPRTRFRDELTLLEAPGLKDIQVGDFLQVSAVVDPNTPVARRVDRVQRGDDVLQAPVEKIVANARITLQGLEYLTRGARFFDYDGTELLQQDFFAGLRPGHLVKVRDTYPAEGVAEEVRFAADPNDLPPDPNAYPEDPNAIPEDPNSLPEDPNALPEDPNAVPEDPNTIPGGSWSNSRP